MMSQVFAPNNSSILEEPQVLDDKQTINANVNESSVADRANIISTNKETNEAVIGKNVTTKLTPAPSPLNLSLAPNNDISSEKMFTLKHREMDKDEKWQEECNPAKNDASREAK